MEYIIILSKYTVVLKSRSASYLEVGVNYTNRALSPTLECYRVSYDQNHSS